ncbi:MAG: hypothetical protein LBU58_11625, partial [Clostridiales bacterium]|nr:hypothetical protein [Clostridiales bacterium]
MAEGRGDSRRGGAASQSSGTGRSTPETARQSPGIAGRKGTVALLIATGVLWSLGGVFIKTTDAHPLTISALRSLAAAAAMFAILLGRPRFLFSKVQIVGALSYAATLTLFVAANKLTTAAN